MSRRGYFEIARLSPSERTSSATPKVPIRPLREERRLGRCATRALGRGQEIKEAIHGRPLSRGQTNAVGACVPLEGAPDWTGGSCFRARTAPHSPTRAVFRGRGLLSSMTGAKGFRRGE